MVLIERGFSPHESPAESFAQRIELNHPNAR